MQSPREKNLWLTRIRDTQVLGVFNPGNLFRNYRLRGSFKICPTCMRRGFTPGLAASNASTDTL